MHKLSNYGQARLNEYERRVVRFISLAGLVAVLLGLSIMAVMAQGQQPVPVPVEEVRPMARIAYGPWIVGVLDFLKEIAVIVFTGLLTAFLYKQFPFARAFLTDAIVSRYLRQWMDMGINQVEGAMKDKTLDIPTGSRVVAAVVNRATDRANVNSVSKFVHDLAGGPEEIANKAFRALKLEDAATDAKVIVPAMEIVKNRIPVNSDRARIIAKPNGGQGDSTTSENAGTAGFQRFV